MITENDVRVAMEMAVARKENWYPNGTINFNYVDADAFMDCVGDHNDKEAIDQFYTHFEKLADLIAAEVMEAK